MVFIEATNALEAEGNVAESWWKDNTWKMIGKVGNSTYERRLTLKNVQRHRVIKFLLVEAFLLRCHDTSQFRFKLYHVLHLLPRRILLSA